jgi:hypothetical protein
MKVKEYRFHIPIYHIFWALQFAELPECIAVSKLQGLDPETGSSPSNLLTAMHILIHYGGTLHTVKSVAQAIQGLTVTLPVILTYKGCDIASPSVRSPKLLTASVPTDCI